MRMEAIRLPPRLTTLFVAAVVFEADDWPDRHAPVAASAARIAIAAAAVTKRSRHPNCLVKTCPGGQEIGRSKTWCASNNASRNFPCNRPPVTGFIQQQPIFWLRISADSCSSFKTDFPSNSTRRNHLVTVAAGRAAGGIQRAPVSRHADSYRHPSRTHFRATYRSERFPGPCRPDAGGFAPDHLQPDSRRAPSDHSDPRRIAARAARLGAGRSGPGGPGTSRPAVVLAERSIR